MNMLYFSISLVVAQRLVELALAQYNTRRLKAKGAVEMGAGHYPWFVILHASWLLAIFWATPDNSSANPWLLSLFVLLQCGRVWVISSLGRFWTTRVIILRGEPMVKTGLYRYVRHPNYIIVAAEIAILPLAFGAWKIAIIWSLLNSLLLMWRIRIEEAANSGRYDLIKQEI